MSMGSSSPDVASWYAHLSMSDPRCDNKSCIAYAEAAKESQAQIIWLSQLLGGHYVAWFYAIILALFIGVFGFHQCRDRLHWSRSTPSQWRSHLIALMRSFTYRRYTGKLSVSLSLPSFGVLFLVLFFFLAAALLAFAQHPYYRARRGFGSPPLTVLTGMMALALFPIEIVLVGKYNLITLLTGIGHEKLNCSHRWVGYFMLLLSIVHAVPCIYQPLHEGGYAQLHKQWYSKGQSGSEFTGTPTLGMLVGLSVLSIPPICRRMYEVFVKLHTSL